MPADHVEEKTRLADPQSFANQYVKRIHYGNRTPPASADSDARRRRRSRVAVRGRLRLRRARPERADARRSTALALPAGPVLELPLDVRRSDVPPLQPRPDVPPVRRAGPVACPRPLPRPHLRAIAGHHLPPEHHRDGLAGVGVGLHAGVDAPARPRLHASELADHRGGPRPGERRPCAGRRRRRSVPLARPRRRGHPRRALAAGRRALLQAQRWRRQAVSRRRPARQAQRHRARRRRADAHQPRRRRADGPRAPRHVDARLLRARGRGLVGVQELPEHTQPGSRKPQPPLARRRRRRSRRRAHRGGSGVRLEPLPRQGRLRSPACRAEIERRERGPQLRLRRRHAVDLRRRHDRRRPRGSRARAQRRGLLLAKPRLRPLRREDHHGPGARLRDRRGVRSDPPTLRRHRRHRHDRHRLRAPRRRGALPQPGGQSVERSRPRRGSSAAA